MEYKPLTLHTPMKRSWLVQRMKLPLSQLNELPTQGLPKGEIVKEGFVAILDHLRFDYMGSAEFEYGAVPRALQFLKAQGDLGTLMGVETEVEIEGTAVRVWVLVPQVYIMEALLRLHDWGRETPYMKEALAFRESVVSPEKGWAHEFVGWLELDNGFAFFTDKRMWHTLGTLLNAEFSASETISEKGGA